MTTVTKQQIIDFVNAQPDDRPVEMGESVNIKGECGCVMVHYGREVLPFPEGNRLRGCDFHSWLSILKIDDDSRVFATIEDLEDISDVLNTNSLFSGTYGDIKANLVKKELK